MFFLHEIRMIKPADTRLEISILKVMSGFVSFEGSDILQKMEMSLERGNAPGADVCDFAFTRVDFFLNLGANILRFLSLRFDSSHLGVYEAINADNARNKLEYEREEIASSEGCC